MPAGKRQQSNMTLFTLVFFVGWSILTTILAAVFFVQADDYKKSWQETNLKIEELASSREQNQLTSLIGKESGSKMTWVGSLADYHDRTLALLQGLPVADAAARDKLAAAASDVNDLVASAQPYLENDRIDPNTGAVVIAQKLVQALDNQNTAMAQLTTTLQETQAQAKARFEASQQREAELEQEKETYHQQALELGKMYDEIKATLQQNSEGRVSTLLARIDEYRQARDDTQQQLLRTEEELAMVTEKLQNAQDTITGIKPNPDKASMAYIPDGKITLVDEAAGVVYLNLGSDNRVYKGLTFGVYDQGSAIPKDGKAKAEVEIFKIADETSMARVVSSDPADPIVSEDIIGNLIWNENTVQQFVLAGDFDLNLDGSIDADAEGRISHLIQTWGGVVNNELSAETAALILGQQPQVPAKPTMDDLETDPLAEDRYNAAQERLDQYLAVKKKAQGLLVPAYPYETFLYLIGYKGSAEKAGAF